MSLTKQEQFKEMLLNLSTRIGNEELESMKFMMKPTEDDNASIPMRILHQINTVLALFEEMIQRDIIRADNIEVLKTMLRTCTGNRQPLVDIVKRYELGEAGGGGGRQLLNARSPGQIGEDLKDSHAFNIVVRSIGKNWRELARTLGLLHTDIQAIEVKYPNQLKEQGRECLNQWVDMNYGRVRQQDLVRALRKCQFNMLAHNVENCSTYAK